MKRITDELETHRPDLRVRLDEEVTPDALRRVAAGDLTAAVVMETPTAARRHGGRIDGLRDEPLLAALPQSHQFATADAIRIGAFCLVLADEPWRGSAGRGGASRPGCRGMADAASRADRVSGRLARSGSWWTRRSDFAPDTG